MLKYILLFLISSQVFAHDITAKSWLIADETHILAGENTDKVRPIASITKLVTVLTALDIKEDLDEVILTPDFGYMTKRELINMAIVRSNNSAADLLCRTYFRGYKNCIADMNYKVQRLGMMNTKLFDATGLNRRNVSTAEDLIKLVDEAAKHPEIVEASKKAKLEVKVKKQWLTFKNTNPLIGERNDIIVSKTGWTHHSGGCIVMRIASDKGYRTIVLLGSQNTHTRIPEAEYIVSNY